MKIHSLSEIFKRLGITKHASKVYTLLLKSGPLLATDIVSRTRLYRPGVYRALYELLDEKLLIKTKKGKRYLWSAASPKRLTSLFKDAVRQAEALEPKTILATEEIVTDSIKLFHGPEGIRSVFNDVIGHTKRGDTFYRYTSERDLDHVNSYLSKDYRARRDEKKLERLVISNPISGSRKTSRLERFVKYMPPEAGLFTQNVIEMVYGDRIAFIDLNTEESLIIENPALAEFQKVIFKQLYKKL